MRKLWGRIRKLKMVSQKNEEKDCYFSCRNGYEKCPRHTKEICGYCCAVRRKIRKGKHTLSHFGWWYRNIGRHLRVPFHHMLKNICVKHFIYRIFIFLFQFYTTFQYTNEVSGTGLLNAVRYFYTTTRNGRACACLFRSEEHT